MVQSGSDWQQNESTRKQTRLGVRRERLAFQQRCIWARHASTDSSFEAKNGARVLWIEPLHRFQQIRLAELDFGCAGWLKDTATRRLIAVPTRTSNPSEKALTRHPKVGSKVWKTHISIISELIVESSTTHAPDGITLNGSR